MNKSSRSMLKKRKGYGGYAIPNTTAWQQGVVMKNGFFDFSSVDKLKSFVRSQDESGYVLFYNAPINDKVEIIFQGQAVFRLKGILSADGTHKNKFYGTIADDGSARVIGCLNGTGFFDKDGSKRAVLEAPHAGSEKMKRYIQRNFDFVGFSQTHFNMTEGGLQAYDNRMDFAIQQRGTETIINTGKDYILPWKRLVWEAPDRDHLDLYPPRLNNNMEGRDPDTVLFAIKMYDPADDFNIVNLYRAHTKTFDVKFGYILKEPCTYLPQSFDHFGIDYTWEGFMQNIFADRFISNLMQDVTTIMLMKGELNENDADKITPSENTKILMETQRRLVNVMCNVYANKEEKLHTMLVTKTTLRQIETQMFTDTTSLLRCNKQNNNSLFDFVQLGGGAWKALISIINNNVLDAQDRTVGYSLTGALPGYGLDVFISRA